MLFLTPKVGSKGWKRNPLEWFIFKNKYLLGSDPHYPHYYKKWKRSHLEQFIFKNTHLSGSDPI